MISSSESDNTGSSRQMTPLEQWRASGLAEAILARPVERQILREAYARLQKQAKLLQSPMQPDEDGLALRSSSSFHSSSHPSNHHFNTVSTVTSESVFVCSSQAGLGAEDLLQALPKDNICHLDIDCDRGSHPDPHIPIIRALSAWATARLQEETTTKEAFLKAFAKAFQQSLETAELRFIKNYVPQLHKLLMAHETVSVDTQWSPRQRRRYSFRNSPSSLSARHAETLYSCQKLATVFRPAFSKFVYSLSAATLSTWDRANSAADGPHQAVVTFQNLHRGDEVLLETLRCLLHAHDSLGQWEQPFLLVVTYKHDPSHYMTAAIEWAYEDLIRSQVNKSRLLLQPLPRTVLASRLEEFLQLEDQETLQALLDHGCGSWLVSKKLEHCVSSGTLQWDCVTSTWAFQGEVPPTSPRALCGLDCLSPQDCEFLQIFACLGMKTTKSILVHAHASEMVEEQLAMAVTEGFLETSGQESGEYSFVHESLRDLLYQEIPKDDRPKFHHQLGQNLWLSFDLEELDKQIVTVVENLLLGRPCLPSLRRRAAVATLCLRAGELRADVSAYRSAHFYFTSAMELLSNAWEEEYDLCLALYSSACEVSFCLALWDDVLRVAEVIFSKARSFDDAMRAHISKIYALGTQGDCSTCIDYGVWLLSQLGEPVPVNPSQFQAFRAVSRTSRRLKGLTDEHIMRLPSMTNANKVAAMRTLNALLPYIFSTNYLLIAVVVDKMIELTLKHGTSALSGIAFAMMAAGQCWQGDVAHGQRFGALALRLTEEFRVDSWTARVSTMYYSSVLPWRRPFHESLKPMRVAKQVSLASGDIEFAMINANLFCVLELDVTPIEILLKKISEYHTTMTRFGQAVNKLMLYPSLYILLSCEGGNHSDFTVIQDAKQLSGPFDERNPGTSLVSQWCHYARMLVAYLFDDIQGAQHCAILCSSLVNHPVGSADIAMPCLIDGLLSVERCRRRRILLPLLLPRARRRLAQLRRFAIASPRNFLGKLHLLKAELASICGLSQRALLHYESAIVLLRDAGFFLQSALANELAAKHFLRRKDIDRAEVHMEEAEQIYRRWGGHVSVNQERLECCPGQQN